MANNSLNPLIQVWDSQGHYQWLLPQPQPLTAAPTASTGAPLGQVVVVPSTNSAYILTSGGSGNAAWQQITNNGGAAGTFTAITTTVGPNSLAGVTTLVGGATTPANLVTTGTGSITSANGLTVTAGGLDVIAGGATITAGGLDVVAGTTLIGGALNATNNGLTALQVVNVAGVFGGGNLTVTNNVNIGSTSSAGFTTAAFAAAPFTSSTWTITNNKVIATSKIIFQ